MAAVQSRYRHHPEIQLRLDRSSKLKPNPKIESAWLPVVPPWAARVPNVVPVVGFIEQILDVQEHPDMFSYRVTAGKLTTSLSEL